MKGGVFAFALLSFVMAAVVGLFSMESEERTPSGIRIGAPDDSAGLVIHCIVGGSGFEAGKIASDYDPYVMKDCCAGTSEWAFGTNRLDVALMCPDAARRLVEKSSMFEIAGPAVLNSDVLVIRPGAVPKRIGIAHRRFYQERLVTEWFTSGCSVVPMLPASLPFAFERGVVDAVVVDVLKAFALSGERISVRRSGADVVTYVLVARKDFTASPVHRQFMERYERVVRELGDAENLARALEGYKAVRWTDREVEEWKRLNVRFVFPPKAGA
ncbi:ABC transporter substrate-binding (seleno)protein SaoB [Syntrophobacter fumaroxidans]|uniref:Solute-binding protein family 3/N-terminal domain-containing protein n=1 Tax=Syntrophobacter fumaroxidans (strain DSM 10017 / MPOB) TaxID=335543 RepID=A0LQB1_SYNFM|nr:ABC transporter substrate-binding (seleno)protein SaoB [Syntrophobacter fumaroxidans]ABK19613.1 hypothetical protein Sfum_3944 [Syntrophobacter fumaroxidans MPOB]